MLTLNQLRDLARLSFTEPRRAGAAVIALNPPMEARWMAVVAAVLVGTLTAYLLPLFAGQIAEAPAPLGAVGLQLAANLLAAVLMAQVGRAFGGQGGFADALLLVAWLQAMMALVQMVQVLALLLLPGLAGLVLLLAVGLFFWLLVGFVQALHGFGSPFVVLAGILATMFAAAFVLSFVLILLGVQPPGILDV